MTKQEWLDKIKEDCTKVGTYKEEFNILYNMLADTLIKLEAAQKSFDESGEEVIVMHHNNRGNVNAEQHPAVRLINEMRRDALTYLRDCGLTAAALKKINDDELTNLRQKPSALAEALKKLG